MYFKLYLDNKINFLGVEKFSTNLRSIPRLTSLNIAGNRIGDIGITILYKYLIFIASLSYLNITGILYIK